MITAKMILEQKAINTNVFVLEYPYENEKNHHIWNELSAMHIPYGTFIDKNSESWNQRYLLKVEVVCEKSFTTEDETATAKIVRFSFFEKFFAIATICDKTDTTDFLITDNTVYKQVIKFIKEMLVCSWETAQYQVDLTQNISFILTEELQEYFPEFEAKAENNTVFLDNQ